MHNNDVLRRLRYVFDYDDQTMASIFELGGCQVTQDELSTWLARDEDDRFVACKDVPFERFLNGLIIK